MGGTAYIVQLANGRFEWLSSSEFGSDNPNKGFILEEGDVVVVISGAHHHDYAKVGDRFRVYKVINDVDHYGIYFNNDLKWYGGFQLVKYF